MDQKKVYKQRHLRGIFPSKQITLVAAYSDCAVNSIILKSVKAIEIAGSFKMWFRLCRLDTISWSYLMQTHWHVERWCHSHA